MTKIVEFENALDDLISEMIEEEDLEEFETYYEGTTLISVIKQALQVGMEDVRKDEKHG